MTEPSPENLIRQTVDGSGNQPIGQMSDGAAIQQARDVYIGAAPAKQTYTSLHQLPRDIGDFTGRSKQIQTIEAGLTQVGTAVPIVAVSGMPGVGKSALAIHVAHQLKGQFPDAQLYVDLRGVGERPLAPEDVLVEWLRAFGIEDSQIPPSLDERVKLYRQQLEGKRVLVILDNASTAEQVRPLLMGSSSCGVLITSRQRLAALAGAKLVDLFPMEETEALELLQELAGEERLHADQETAQQIVELCGRLPLAVRIAGAFLRQKVHWSLGEYGRQLADEHNRLKQLTFDQWNVQASFNLSYEALSDEEKTLFCTMAVMPQDFEIGLVEGITESEAVDVKTILERLIDGQLLEPLGNKRYRYHDLMRLFALGKLPGEEAEQIQQRIVDWYKELTYLFNDAFLVNRRKQTAEQLGVDEATFYQYALNWFEVERNNLLWVVTWLKEQTNDETLISFADNLINFFNRRSYWLDWVNTHEIALTVARQTNNKAAESRILNNLGMVYDSQGRWNDAIACYNQSLDLKRALGDRHGEGQTLNNLGVVYKAQGRWDDAIACYNQSLDFKRALGDRHGEGNTLNNLGLVYKTQGRWDDAIACYEQDLAITRALGDRYGEGNTFNNLGVVYKAQGRWDDAISCYNQSLDLTRALGDRHGEGITLENLGDVYLNHLNVVKAFKYWNEALEKLHPDSPNFKSLQRELNQRKSLKWLLKNCLLEIGLLLFLFFNVVGGHGGIGMVLGVVLVGCIGYKIWKIRRY